MYTDNLPFNPYNNKFNLEQKLLKLKTKFNKIVYFSNKVILLDKNYDDNMKKISENTFLYYFNKIRIYYLNYKRSERQLKENILNFKIDKMKHIQSNYNKTNQTNKTNNSYKFSGKTTFNFKKVNTYIPNSKITFYQSFLNNLENTINEYNIRNINRSKENIIEDNNTNRNLFKKYIKKNLTNRNKIYKSRKLFKKLYRKISVKTHPDKIKKYSLEKQQFYKYLFMKSKKAYNEHVYYILILIAVILNIKTYKLHWPDKCMLDLEIEDLVKSRIIYIKHRLFNYNNMTQEQKNKIVKEVSII